MIELSDQDVLAAQAAGLLPTLLKNSGDNDESVRRMVSQALGRLAALNPAKGLALVEDRFDCIFAVCNRLTRGPHDHHVWLTFTLSFTHKQLCL